MLFGRVFLLPSFQGEVRAVENGFTQSMLVVNFGSFAPQQEKRMYIIFLFYVKFNTLHLIKKRKNNHIKTNKLFLITIIMKKFLVPV